MARKHKPKRQRVQFAVVVKGKHVYRANPEEEYSWEGPASESFREWVSQGNQYGTVEYVQLWRMFDGVEDPKLVKERRW